MQRRKINTVLFVIHTLCVNNTQNPLWRPSRQAGQQFQLQVRLINSAGTALLHLHDKGLDSFAQAYTFETVEQ